MPQVIETTPDFVKSVYATTRKNLEVIKERLNRPLTLTEKILYGHLADAKNADLTRGTAYIDTHPDRVALQDATAQMAILQFMQAGKDEADVPVTIHCDHLIRGYVGAKKDLETANFENNEVYNFLATAGQRYGFGFWKPGSGIIHQVVLEQYAFPGLMMLGTDSHTPNAGGLGAFAAGVGGADAVDVMVGLPWEVLHPEIVGVKLTGQLRGWAAPKDVIQKLLDILTVKGGTNRVIEYFGEGVATLSATGRATICNMGAELGATTSVFPYDARMATYLKSTMRENLIDIIEQNLDLLVADAGSEAHYDKIIEIDLASLEPTLVGPHSPDLFVKASGMPTHLDSDRLKALNNGKSAPANLTAALIGSCTNSSYEDMGRIAQMADVLTEKGVALKTKLLVTPGSEQVRETIERDGQMESLKKLGAIVLANACGPCIGQWQRDDIKAGDLNSIISSYNRNFPKRNDGNAATCSFIASPETVLAYAIFGRLDIDAFSTPIEAKDGTTFTLNDIAPTPVDEVPELGFAKDEHGYVGPTAEGANTQVVVKEDSERLQILEPFPAWDGKDYVELPLLMKARGKCTTDHISAAGPWLKFRGHLDNISNNMLIGAVNAFSPHEAPLVGKVKNTLTGVVAPTPDVARDYKANGLGWVVVGDENYGEGSSREHAAMCPRLLGAKVVMTRSFARIHQTNLKKQGVLPLTFVNPADYNLIEEGDRFTFHDLAKLAPKANVTCTVHHADGSSVDIELAHTYNKDQLAWFRAGSALNALKK